MAAVDVNVVVERNVLNAWVDLGILEQNLAVDAAQLVVSQVKGP